ncbi:MAG: histidinol dehydrogenase [Proteobacteria bacterium]|nr:histidinol dehydrogenase [Pseudomonadota bacterium]
MPHTYLKKAEKSPQTETAKTRTIVADMLAEIETKGESAALAYAKKLDDFEGTPLLTPAEIKSAASQVPPQLKTDIALARKNVETFAKAQLASIQEFETELMPGLIASQKLIPITTAGCYVPGGRYSHVASAIMSITTARVAGVENIIATTSPAPGTGKANPAIIYAMAESGADSILTLGGVQGIAALAFGLFTKKPAQILVGPGNRFVAEAKRMLYGRVGIDMFAGPTEIAIIADETADPDIVATDLVSQAEHGMDSPAWLLTTSESLAKAAMKKVATCIADLPEATKATATASWQDYGEVVLADSREDLVALSDQYAAEHVELQTADNDWFVDNLTNYGSLFIGEESCVSHGDKCSGPNHILPTKGAAQYSGGLSVHKFLKVLTTQRMTESASKTLAPVTARISRLEGMEAHARAADIRANKYA